MRKSCLFFLILILLVTSCSRKAWSAQTQCNAKLCITFELLDRANSFAEPTTFRLTLKGLTDLESVLVVQSSILGKQIEPVTSPVPVVPSQDNRELAATLTVANGQDYIFESKFSVEPPKETGHHAYRLFFLVYHDDDTPLKLSPYIYTDGNGRVIDEFAFETLVATNLFPNMTPGLSETPLPTKTRSPMITPANTATPSPSPYPIGDPSNSIATPDP